MSNPIRVLYVDNDTHSLDVRAGILEDEYGFDVLSEGSVPAAKERLTEESVDCVLSDFRMPGEDGLDFLTFVRETYPALPFILFTTHDSQEIVEKAFDAGATDFFPKSLVNVSYELLVKRIEQAVRLHRTTETLVQRTLDDADRHPRGTVPSWGLGDYSSLQQPSGRSGTTAEVSQPSAQTPPKGAIEDESLTVDAGEVAKRASSVEADPVESRTLGGPESETTPGQLAAEDVDARQTALQRESRSDRAVTVGELADALRIAIDEAVDRALDGRSDNREESQSTADEGSSPVDGGETPTDDVVANSEASADETDATTACDAPPSAESDPADNREESSGEPMEADSPPESAAAESDDASEPRYDDATVQNRFYDRRETLGWISSDELPSVESSSARSTESGARSGRSSGRASQPRRSDAVRDRRSREASRRGENAVEGRRGSGDSAVERRQVSGENAVDRRQRSGENPTTSGAVETANASGEQTDGGESAATEASRAEADAAGAEAEPPEPDTESRADTSHSEAEASAAQVPTPTDGATAVNGEASGDGGTVVDGEGSADGGANGGGLFDDDSATETEDTSADDDGFGALEDGYPDGFDPGSGDSVLVQCGSQDQRKHDICVDLCTRGDTERSVLLVRYRRLDDDQLRRIVTDAAQVKIISLGYSQPVPDDLQGSVERVSINNPNDVTRIGTVITATLDDWDGDVSLCYDPVDGLLRYKSTERAFRFLHILIGRLRSAGAISHFHADPLSSDPQEINTLKPLYDATVNVDSMGTHLE